MNKEITHDGETFVPSVRLLEITECKNNNRARIENGIEALVYGYKENIRRVLEEDVPLFFIQNLVKWHFNLMDPEEKGFIDINTLSENPYE